MHFFDYHDLHQKSITNDGMRVSALSERKQAERRLSPDLVTWGPKRRKEERHSPSDRVFHRRNMLIEMVRKLIGLGLLFDE